MKTLAGKNGNWRKIAVYLPLAIACIFSISLILPTINNNINDPNHIIYFNTDEGGTMDVVWWYFSGEKRDSFMWDYDYGLELLHLSDLARLILARFVNFTPGTFVLILRWLHLIAWILALVALWHFMSRHFGGGWQPIVTVLLLGTRPAFAYFSNNLKPEPLVLFLMIVGLDYTLRIIENSANRNLFIAIAMAAVALIIKFAGLFLLPAIVASMYFANRYKGKNIFRKIKIAWILPSLFGLLIISFLLVVIAFYVRKSTGSTWYAQFGFWGSLLENKSGLFLFFIGIFLVFLSGMIWVLNKNDNPLVKKVMAHINEINSHAFIVCGIFLGFITLFGFRWIISPKYFILTYAQIGPAASSAMPISVISEKGLSYPFLKNIINQIKVFDPIILSLFACYLGIEIYGRCQNFKNEPLKSFKRFVLLIFLVPSFIYMFSMLRMAQHHMLPFFVAMSILAIQGIYMFKETFNYKKLLKNCLLASIGMLLITDILVNGADVVNSRVYQSHQNEDIAFDIAKWWRKNIPVDARIVADHYNNAYIPPEYNNIETLRCNHKGRVEELRQLVDDHHPQFIYYNTRPIDGTLMPPIEEILPDKEVKLIKSFESKGRNYQRNSDDKFVIYEVLDKKSLGG